jgi:hypothetical protein
VSWGLSELVVACSGNSMQDVEVEELHQSMSAPIQQSGSRMFCSEDAEL